MLRKIIIANWKLNPITSKEAESILKSIVKNLPKKLKSEVVVCPPFVYLSELKKISKRLSFGAQNVFYEDKGAYTGEISSAMLANIGIKYVILGHSERKSMGETNLIINKKLKSTISSGLIPILCVGENERDTNHEYLNIVKSQIEECLSGINKNLYKNIIIAYEPVWALSSTIGRHDANPSDSREMSIFIRKIISDLSTPKIASDMRVIYGGSVSERDVAEFLVDGGVDGVLVGKASLDPKKFSEIIKICETLKN